MNKFFPFLDWLPLARKHWKDDLSAGITGTVIVVPQAVAFAMIAGLPPIYGLYTAMITPVIAALFGSSHHLISGPATAISMVVFASISVVVDSTNVMRYVELTILLTFMAGLVQFFMGVLKMGKLVNFISHSVIIGFTAGAGILIAFKQLKYIFGIPVPTGAMFYEIIQILVSRITETNPYVFSVAIGTLLIALIIKLFIKPISKYYMLIAMILGSVFSLILGGSAKGIQTVGDIKPDFANFFNVPNFNFDDINVLLPAAFVLAIIGLVEAVAIGKSIALKTHQNINGNQEFIGQGLSNMIASFFSSFAGSGSFTRSVVNYQAGAKTPMSAIFATLGLLLVLLFGAKYASYLPKAAMGGIILLVGYSLIDFHHIKTVVRSSKRETIVLFSTLLGTLFLHLEFALLLGIFFSLFFYLERTSNIHIAILGLNREKRFVNDEKDDSLIYCPQLKIVRIEGSIYFGAIEKLTNSFADIYNNGYKYVLIDAKGMNFIDLAGAEWLTHEAYKFRKKGGHLIIVGAKLTSRDVLLKGGFADKIGKENFYANKSDAIADIYKVLDKDICKNCKKKVFKECY